MKNEEIQLQGELRKVKCEVSNLKRQNEELLESNTSFKDEVQTLKKENELNNL